MPIPWMFALRSIPWATIVANAPAIVRSAESLLTRANARRREPADAGASAGPHELQGLVERVASLEQRDSETAALLSQVTQQFASLTTATEVLEARVRWLLLLGIISTAVSLLALGLVVFTG
jgi:hypothetical protein